MCENRYFLLGQNRIINLPLARFNDIDRIYHIPYPITYIMQFIVIHKMNMNNCYMGTAGANS